MRHLQTVIFLHSPFLLSTLQLLFNIIYLTFYDVSSLDKKINGNIIIMQIYLAVYIIRPSTSCSILSEFDLATTQKQYMTQHLRVGRIDLRK